MVVTAVSTTETNSTNQHQQQDLHGKDGRAKVEIALARGKQKQDKRADLAKKDDQRRMERALREKYR
ncbi:MAG: SsrA-binding protein [Ardenticatenaceae bacterium]|nr:SsrA-binding protein [Ardenticatenaceae bacterium]